MGSYGYFDGTVTLVSGIKFFTDYLVAMRKRGVADERVL
jgi:hypothetical protein